MSHLGRDQVRKAYLDKKVFVCLVHLSHKGGLAGQGKPITEHVVTRLTNK